MAINTIYRLIRLNRLLKSHRIKFALALGADLLHLRHLFIRLDPVFACNLRCSMCTFCNDDYREKNAGRFSEEEIERIAHLFFSRTLQLVIGCGAEPTLYTDFPALIQLGKTYGIPYIGFVTNGQLLSEKHLEKFISCGLDELILSVHGVTKETYESFMVNASYDKMLHLLKCLEEAKGKFGATKPELRINYTLNPDNLDELGRFFEIYGGYRIKTLQIRPVMNLGPTAYTKNDLSGHLPQYRETIKTLAEKCRKRKINFLAPKVDPSYGSESRHSVILEAVLRNISPQNVWRPDFNWKEESYEDFCKRIRWRRYLIKCIFSRITEIKTRDTSLTYEVDVFR